MYKITWYIQLTYNHQGTCLLLKDWNTVACGYFVFVKFIFRHPNRVWNEKLLIFCANEILNPLQLGRPGQLTLTWWRHQMKTFSALLALCAGNSPVPVNSPHKCQWRWALIFSFDLRLNKRLSKQPRGWWFETPPWSLWRQCNEPETSPTRCNSETQLTYYQKRRRLKLSWYLPSSVMRLVPPANRLLLISLNTFIWCQSMF